MIQDIATDDVAPSNLLTIYRMIGGRRVPHLLKLDAAMTVLAEEPLGHDDGDRTQFGIDDRGTRVLSHVSELDKQAMGFFVPGKPCWFPGCEGLREAYGAALTQAAAKQGQRECKGCARTAVMRAFLPRVKSALLEAEKNHATQAG